MGRQITTRRNFHLKSLLPDVNHLAVIIESAVLSESVRRHEAKACRQLWTFQHMREGLRYSSLPLWFYATGHNEHDGELAKMIRICGLGLFCRAVAKNAALHNNEIRKTTFFQNFVCATVEVASIGNSCP